MRAADTNVLVRLLVRDDAPQVAAAEEFVASGVWVSHVVLAEVAWALESVYALAPAQVADAVGLLFDSESIVFQQRDVVSAALTRFRASPRVGFADCLILEVARDAGHEPLGTFDRHLGKLEGTQKL